METIKVLEPRVSIREDMQKNHTVLMGGMRVTEQINTADSWQSTNLTQALWNINPPSTQTIVDRFMKIRCYMEVKADADLQLGTNDALRQFPISSMTDTLTMQVNGESVSDNLGDKIHAMLCYGNNRDDRMKSWSMSPCMPDNYQQYSDWTLYGSAKNPLADYGENNGEDPRGGFPVEIVDAKTFRAVVTEPIFISPMFAGVGQQEEGMVNVNQFNISFRWKSNPSIVLSHSSAGNAVTSVTVSFYQAPEILTTYITPDLTEPIPPLQVLPYHKPQDYIKSVSLLADGASTRVISDTIKLSQIPRRLYLFVRHSRQTTTFNTSDSFLRIDRVDILWNNQSGLFASATPQDLYEISRRNGLNLTYQQWRKYRGGVFCLEFGKDIGLLDNEAPGVQGQYTIQIQMDVTNVSGDDFTGEFYQVMLMEGTFSVSENQGRASLGNLTKEAVLQSKASPEITFDDYENLQGGSFFSKLKNITHKIARGVQKASKFVQPAVDTLAPEFAPLVRSVGEVARQTKRATRKGGRIAGGGIISRRDIRR